MKNEEIQLFMNLNFWFSLTQTDMNFLNYVIDYRLTFGGIIKGTQVWIFHHSDFHDFYTIKPSWVGDFGD